MESFLGVLLGSVVGWILLVRENERLESRRVNGEALASLSRAMSNYLVMALEAQGDEDRLAFVVRRASTIGRDHLTTMSGVFDAAEQAALGKLETDLADAVREIGNTTDRDANAAAYDRWAIRLNDQFMVLRRAAYDFTKPGVRSLFRRY